MSVLSISLPVFAIIFTGYLAARKEIIPSVATKYLTNYVFYFATPFLLFTTMAKVPINSILNFSYIAAYALSTLFVAVLSFMLFKLSSNKSISVMTLRVMGSCFVNSTYLGIPLLIGAFGNAVPVVLVIIFQIIFITPIILTLLEIGQGAEKVTLNIFKEIPFVIIKNPIIIGSFIGIVFAFFKLELPLIISKYVDMMSSGAITTGLFALGLSLADKTITINNNDKMKIGYIVFAKILLHPLIAYLLGRFIFDLDHYWLASLTLMAAMPSAMNFFIFAQKFEVNGKKAATIVMLTTSISVITITGLLYILL